jgi:glycosyltransferase involved in cell wall biosynthesis
VTSPLCSVITGTWQRRRAVLENAIPQVQRQTYPNLEHLIVSEGPDDDLDEQVGWAPER